MKHMTCPENSKPLKILVVEDNHLDQHVIVQALKVDNFLNELYIVDNGLEAMEYLHQKGKYADPKVNPRPDVVLLDIKMPKMDGREVLKLIKKHPRLNSIPVIMVTTSDYDKYIIESYHLDVKGYISKPFTFGQFMDAIINL